MINFSVKKPYTVVVAVIIIIILGVVAFTGMQVDLLPNINLPYAVVITSYTGASPEQVETVVTKPLEQSMAMVSNIKSINSVSSENSSMVILEFAQDTDMTAIATEMREKIDMVKPFWDDENIGSPMILQLNPNMIPITVASVDMEGMDAAELSAFVNDTVLSELESVEGVASVSAMGLAANNINITIDDERLDDINDAIGASINGDINKAKRQLASARSQIQNGYGQLETAKAEGEAKLNAAQSELDAGKKQIAEQKGQLEAAVSGLEQEISGLEGTIADLENKKSGLEQEIASHKEKGEAVPAELTSELADIEKQIKENKTDLEEKKSQLEETKSGLAQVEASEAQLSESQAQIDSGRAELDTQLSTAKSQLDSGMSQLNSGAAQLNSAAASAKKKADIKQYITKEMLSGVLMAQNFAMPAGTVDTDEGKFSVSVGKDISSLEELGDLLLFEMDIAGVDDIRIKDVATVEFAGIDEEAYTKVNGNDGILLSFEKQSNYSTSDVSENINDCFAELSTENEGLTFVSFMDQGEYVRMIIFNIIKNLLYGAILAIIVLVLCLKDFRPTVIVAVSIPVSLLFAVVMMYFTGVTMNIISMSGLALGVGMLVDNSIVVIENIYRLRHEGVPVLEAAVKGTRQVGGAITASTLTTISVFIPILFTNGLAKELFLDMGLTIGFSLVASLLVAVTVVPAMGGKVLVSDTQKPTPRFDKLKSKYEISLKWVLAHKGLTVAVVCVLLVGFSGLAVSRGYSFMPSYETTELSATLTPTEEAKESMDKDSLYAAADAVTEVALGIDGVNDIGVMAGGEAASLSSMMGGEDDVSFYLALDRKHPAKAEEVEKALSDKAAEYDCDIEVVSSTDMTSLLGGTGVILTVRGNDLQQLSDFTKQLGEDMASIKGVEEISSQMEDPSSRLMITVDKDKAIKKELTVAQVYQAVAKEIASGQSATSLTIDGTDYDVFVLDDEDSKISIDDIKDIEVDKKITVDDLATVTREDSPSSIYRQNQERYMTVTALVAEGEIVSKVSADVDDFIASYDVPDGIDIEVGGESANVFEYIVELIKAIALALVLMYLIMVAQFQSLKYPFIVMFTVPMAFTGGFAFLFIFGFDVSVVALLGFLVLCGIIVNNGIVLVDYINRLIREENMELDEALILAGKTRMRPIFMTAMTTVLALVTMALGIGEGTDMVQPMAVVAIGGLIYATFMTLYFVPVVYAMMNKKKAGGSGKFGKLKKKATARVPEKTEEAVE